MSKIKKTNSTEIKNIIASYYNYQIIKTPAYPQHPTA
jgi:hypothetical protein